MRNMIVIGLAMALCAGMNYAATHIPAGNVFGIWAASGSPYYIDGEIHVLTDSMLRIEPGCAELDDALLPRNIGTGLTANCR